MDIAYLKQLFDLREGKLYWVASRRRVTTGAEAGTQNKQGYRQVKIDGKIYRAHRIIFAIAYGYWPKLSIDHIDCNKANNLPCNLREATLAQNQQNTNLKKNNKCGYKGVRYHKGKWLAALRGGHLGTFLTAEDAAEAYRIAAESTYGSFARV